MNRRQSLYAGASLLGVLAGLRTLGRAAAEDFEIRKTDAEWRRSSAPPQYTVLREHGTERAGTSPLNARSGRHLRLRRL